MAIKKTTTKETHDKLDGIFRRAEDWERITRLEYIVQELVRENEKIDVQIDKLQETQEKMMRVALNIRFLLIGGLVTSGVFITGLSELFPLFISKLITGA